MSAWLNFLPMVFAHLSQNNKIQEHTKDIPTVEFQSSWEQNDRYIRFAGLK